MTQSQHTPLPFSQGITLLTKTTGNWTALQVSQNDYEEHRRVFSGFTGADEGRSRQLVAECRSPEDAAFIVRACNSHYDLTEQRDELLAALKGMLSIRGTWQKDLPGAEISKWPKKAAAAIAKAEGGAE